MSLINQVLKDLAKRSKLSFESEIVLSGLEPYIAPDQIKKSKKQWIAIGAFVVFLVFIISMQIQSIVKHPKKSVAMPIVKDIIQPVMSTDNTMVQEIPLLVYPTQVKDMILKTKEDTTILRFVLSQDALYHISSDAKLNKLTIILENAQGLTKLPVIDYKTSALNDIVMKEQHNGDLAVVLSLRPNAEIKRIELNQLDALPELQLEIVYHASTPINTVTNTQQIPIEKNIIVQHDVTPSKKVATNDPGDVELQARILVDQGRFLDALTLLKKTNPAINQYPDYYALLAAIYQHEGSSTQAAGLYRKLLSIKPDQSKWWVGLGVALETVGRNSEALEAYTEARNNKQNLTPELQTYLQDRIENL